MVCHNSTHTHHFESQEAFDAWLKKECENNYVDFWKNGAKTTKSGKGITGYTYGSRKKILEARTTYCCGRSGRRRVVEDDARQRSTKKESKKTVTDQCGAAVITYKYKDDPLVHVQYKANHNHATNSTNIKYTRLSSSIRAYAYTLFKSGLTLGW